MLLIMMSTCMMYLIIRYYLSVLGMGPRVTRGVSALGTQPSKFGWVGYPTQKIGGSAGRPMGFSSLNTQANVPRVVTSRNEVAGGCGAGVWG